MCCRIRMPIPEELVKAGRIASEVRRDIRRRVAVGMPLYNICEMVEDMARAMGGEPAFPCNVCVNSVTAHYTFDVDDERRVEEGDVVKIDIGVHVEGYIADTATTISFNPQLDGLVQAVEDVLKEALRSAREEARVSEIGRVINETALRRGFKPISNLSGHEIGRYVIHAGVSIPNVWISTPYSLKLNHIYAIEPFVTTMDAAGLVVESGVRRIFSLIVRRRTGDRALDELVELIWARRKTLPFALRFFYSDVERKVLEQMISRLVKMKIIRAYPVLVEAKGGYVAQAEHTVVPVERGIVVITE